MKKRYVNIILVLLLSIFIFGSTALLKKTYASCPGCGAQGQPGCSWSQAPCYINEYNNWSCCNDYMQWTPCNTTCGWGTQWHYNECNCYDATQSCLVCSTPACAGYTYGGWSACSVSCGGGTQTRTVTYTCTGGYYTTESQSCNTQCCPVAGGWTGWGSCQGSCGTGTQYRTCTNPAPSCGGAACVGSSSQSCDTGISCNNAPNAPIVSSPSNSATNVSLTPAIVLSTTDPDSDYLRYKIQLATDAGFTANLQTFDETSSQTGWSGQNTQTSTAYTSGATATYTVQTALSQNLLYYIRAYAKDPGGTNTWSSASTSISFTTTGLPSAPTISTPTNAATGIALAPAITLSATDGQSDYLRYQIQLATDAGFTQNLQTFDETSSQTGWSGQNTQTSTAYTSGSIATYTLQSNLTYGTVYYIRAFAKDPGGSQLWGSASSTSSFTVMLLNAPTNCTVSATVSTGPAIISWTDNSTIEANYLLETSFNGGAFSLSSTLAPDTVTSNQTVATGTYQYRIRVTANSQYSSYCTTSSVVFPLSNFKFEGIRFDGIQIR